MELLYVLMITSLCIIIVYISKNFFSSIVNPMVIFTLWWGGCVSLSLFGFYGLQIPSAKVLCLVFFTILSFNIGCLIGKSNSNTKLKLNSNVSYKGKINEKVIFFTNIISLVYILPYTMKALLIIRSYGLSALRASVFGESNTFFSSMIEAIIVQWLILAIFTATMVINIASFANKRKITKLFILNIVNVIIYSVTFTGRWLIFRFIVVFLFSEIFSRKFFNKSEKIFFKKNKTKKRNILVMILMFLGISSLIMITNERSLTGMNLIGNFLIYFIGPFSLLDIFVLSPDISQIGSIYTFGGATIGGLLTPILIVISSILGIDILRPDEIVLGINGLNYIIAPNITFTAFSTAIYPFIMDFGYLGVILVPSILGLVITSLHSTLIKRNSIALYSYYILFLLFLVTSTLQWDLIHMWPWLSVFFIYVFTYDKNKTHLSWN